MMKKREGFEGQILHVIPGPLMSEMAHHVLLHQLVATDVGWYPRAEGHYCERPQGAGENILIFCVGGRGWCEVDGRRAEVTANQAALIPRSKMHQYGADETDPWSIHWAHLAGPAADYFFHLLPEDEIIVQVSEHTGSRVEELFRECYEAFVGSFAWQRMAYVTQTLQYLLGQLFFNNESFSPLLRSSQSRSLSKTLEYMTTHIDEMLTLDDLADQAGMSRSHFSRIFKEQTGFSPIDYFINLKIQRAAMMLRFTDKTVREISDVIGYGDPYYFSRIFKKVVGVSPTAFRQLPE